MPSDKYHELVDIAVNLSNRIFSLDLDFVVDRATNAGIKKMILTGNTIRMCHNAVTLARDHPGVIFGGVGIHPHFVEKEWNDDTYEVMRGMISLPEVIAVGEVGLDFYRNYSKKEVQIEAFEKQVELACEFQKPLLAHERSSHIKFVEVLSNFSGRLPPIVIHCFTGTKAEMIAYIAMGFYIGITGYICKDTAGKNLREAIIDCPLDRILLESDAPYMIPNASGLEPFHKSLVQKCKTGRNEPCTLPVVASTVAKCLGVEVEEVAKATTENAHRVFNLVKPEITVKDEV
ncbi:predicted protein [Nematostella vectensis]|uniref:Deoxyribonuclease TATDN1 n=1 Tax=Nematostella vectensis TaxID=45351 RepID=A7S6K3_NEMVE|nr:predicted protein [Nematostella vectensis]|eukprot:XP_001632730.1 predicted protein [Nematostella vectensis]